MTTNIHSINLPKLCKLNESIMLILCLKKSAITFGEGCIHVSHRSVYLHVVPSAKSSQAFQLLINIYTENNCSRNTKLLNIVFLLNGFQNTAALFQRVFKSWYIFIWARLDAQTYTFAHPRWRTTNAVRKHGVHISRFTSVFRQINSCPGKAVFRVNTCDIILEPICALFLFGSVWKLTPDARTNLIDMTYIASN